VILLLSTKTSPMAGGEPSRRSFLHRGAFTAAAVAVAGTVPGLSGLVASTHRKLRQSTPTSPKRPTTAAP